MSQGEHSAAVSAYEGMDALRAVLSAQLGDRWSDNHAVRTVHGSGEAFHLPQLPDLVVFPNSTEEVAEVVRACARHGVPVIPYGAGTSLEGGITAPVGGVSINLSAMDRVLSVNDADLDCTVEAGVTREALNLHLRDSGLFFPIDPGANASLGGMAATRASGTTAVRYGTMRDNILSLRVVLSDGTVIRTATRARKSSAGYDLTRLFVGSEGTLGIITEVTLRLAGIPETVAVAYCPFATLEGAVDCVIQTMQLGIPMARIEFLDEVQVRACNLYSRTTLDEVPHLFLEFHGSPRAVAEQIELVGALVAEHGGTGLIDAAEAEARSALWRARHDAYHAAQALRPGTALLVTDVCVPISRLGECVAQTRADIDTTGLVAPIVGHVGDGNFHVMITVDPTDPGEVTRARAFNDRLVARALEMEGTCTGEHGIGVGKREKLVAELGADVVDLMARIKQVLDPAGILNPGKIFMPPPR